MEKLLRLKKVRGSTNSSEKGNKIAEELRKEEPNSESLDEWNEQLSHRESSLLELDREISHQWKNWMMR